MPGWWLRAEARTMSAGLLVSSGQAASPAEILAEILAELQKEY
jgi:hypothetical protein